LSTNDRKTYAELIGRGKARTRVYDRAPDMIDVFFKTHHREPTVLELSALFEAQFPADKPSLTTMRAALDAYVASVDFATKRGNVLSGDITKPRNSENAASAILAISEAQIAAQINAEAERLIAPERERLAKQIEECNASTAIAQARATEAIADASRAAKEKVDAAQALLAKAEQDASARISASNDAIAAIKHRLDADANEITALRDQVLRMTGDLAAAETRQDGAERERDIVLASLEAEKRRGEKASVDASVAYSDIQKALGARIGALMGDVSRLSKELAEARSAQSREVDTKTQTLFSAFSAEVTRIVQAIEAYKANVILIGNGSANREQALFDGLTSIAAKIDALQSELSPRANTDPIEHTRPAPAALKSS
jgi:hypothetical protein